MERMVNLLPSAWLSPPQSGEIFDSLEHCNRRLLVLYKVGLPVNDAIYVFEELAGMAFQPRSVSGIPFILCIEKIMSYLEDGWYSAKGLEAALKQVFGGTMTMFDISYATTIDAKIAVTATRATPKQSSNSLFRNYKRFGKPYQELGTSVPRDLNTAEPY